jgi:citrate synthase
MRFFRKHQKINPAEFVTEHLASLSTEEAGTEGQQDKMSAQFLGFGVRNGGIEIMAIEIAHRLAALEGAGEALQWACAVGAELQPYGIGLLTTGVAAAVFTDLGFQPRAGGSLFQLLGAPGLLAHGLELANKPITAMPFVKDENYDIKR